MLLLSMACLNERSARRRAGVPADAIASLTQESLRREEEVIVYILDLIRSVVCIRAAGRIIANKLLTARGDRRPLAAQLLSTYC